MSKMVELMDIWLAVRDGGGTRTDAYTIKEYSDYIANSRGQYPWEKSAGEPPVETPHEPKQQFEKPVKLQLVKNTSGEEKIQATDKITSLRQGDRIQREIDDEISRLLAAEVKSLGFTHKLHYKKEEVKA